MKGEKTRLGMLLFVLSEGVFFLLLILAYVTYHREQGNGPTAADTLDVTRAGVFSLFLFASSVTMVMAVRARRRDRRGGLVAWLGATIGLGVVFLVGQGTEYAALLHDDVTISRNLFGTTFFTLTGFHGLHVLIGLVLLSVVLGLTRFGGGPRAGMMEAASIYWHFVDGVWVVIFGIVYLWVVL